MMATSNVQSETIRLKVTTVTPEGRGKRGVGDSPQVGTLTGATINITNAVGCTTAQGKKRNGYRAILNIDGASKRLFGNWRYSMQDAVGQLVDKFANLMQAHN